MKYWQQKAEENLNAGDYMGLESLHSGVCALWRQSISKSNSLFAILVTHFLPQNLLPHDHLPQRFCPSDVLPHEVLPHDVLPHWPPAPRRSAPGILPQWRPAPRSSAPWRPAPVTSCPTTFCPRDIAPVTSCPTKFCPTKFCPTTSCPTDLLSHNVLPHWLLAPQLPFTCDQRRDTLPVQITWKGTGAWVSQYNTWVPIEVKNFQSQKNFQLFFKTGFLHVLGLWDNFKRKNFFRLSDQSDPPTTLPTPPGHLSYPLPLWPPLPQRQAKHPSALPSREFLASSWNSASL